MWFLFVLTIGTAISLLDAYVLAKLWAWFVVPQFHIAAMPVAVAFGFTRILGILHKMFMKIEQSELTNKKSEADNKKVIMSHAVQTATATLLMWATAAIAHALL